MLFLDFETYYDDAYSLSKMTTEEYIRDPRFEVMGVSVAVAGGAPQWFSGDFVATHLWLSQFPWSDSAVCAHNARFDLSILAWRFGIHPKLCVDTYSMARPLYGDTLSLSLSALCNALQLGAKGKTVLQMKGKHRADMDEDWQRAYGLYCVQDTELCRKLFRALQALVPKTEILLVDWTIKAYTQPQIVLDAALLDRVVADAEERRRAALKATGVTTEELRSDETLAFLLRALGVDPPVKVSPSTGAQVYAFSKQDHEFMDLLEHEDELVSSLVESRLDSRSTIQSSRAQRLRAIADRGALPFPLQYYGAVGTGRWSGDDKLNLQNLPRRGDMRNTLCAPPGYLLCVADLAQIELRINMFTSGQRDVLAALDGGRDVYADAASAIFGYEVTKETHPVERFVGKVAELSCGYGCGDAKYNGMLKSAARRERVAVDESMAFSSRVVNGYRSARQKVQQQWFAADRALDVMITGGSGTVCGLPFDRHGVLLPTGLRMRYRDLAYDSGTQEKTYTRRSTSGATFSAKIYGAKLVENCVQAIARAVLSDALLRLRDTYRVVGQVHDELILLVPDTAAPEEVVKTVRAGMTAPVPYLPGLQLKASVGIGRRYGECK